MKYLLLIILFLTSFSVFADTCTWSWTAPTTREDGSAFDPATELKEFRLYVGFASGVYGAPIVIAPTETNYIADYTQDVYGVITAVDINGIESAYSNEAMKPLTKPSAPGFKLECTITPTQ